MLRAKIMDKSEKLICWTGLPSLPPVGQSILGPLGSDPNIPCPRWVVLDSCIELIEQEGVQATAVYRVIVGTETDSTIRRKRKPPDAPRNIGTSRKPIEHVPSPPPRSRDPGRKIKP